MRVCIFRVVLPVLSCCCCFFGFTFAGSLHVNLEYLPPTPHTVFGDSDNDPLSEDLEELSYKPIVSENNQVRIGFRAFERDFAIILQQDPSVLTSDCTIQVNDHIVPCSTVSSALYSGVIEGQNSSFVHGYIVDGIFTGALYSDAGNFIIEERKHNQYHSIIYPSNIAYCNLFTVDPILLATVAFTAARKKRQANNDQADSLTCGTPRQPTALQSDFIPVPAADAYYPMPQDLSAQDAPELEKDGNGFYVVRTCPLYVEADHKLFQHIQETQGGDSDTAQEKVAAFLADHVRYLNKVYPENDFRGVTGINFQIKKIKIFTSCTSDNPFCNETQINRNTDAYLSAHSTRDFSEYCSALSMTARNYYPVNGLAWVAKQGYAGGICETYRKFSNGGLSLNTAMVTVLGGNDGSRASLERTYRTCAHEIGHQFGAAHDYDVDRRDRCTGDFIMAHNGFGESLRFSPCSVGDITSILHDMLRQPPDIFGVATVDPSRSSRRNCLRLPETEKTSTITTTATPPDDGPEPRLLQILASYYQSTETNSARACWQQCARDEGCAGATYPNGGSTCYLFGNGFTASISSTYTSFVRDSAVYGLSFNGYRLAGHYKATNDVSDRFECYDLCRSEYSTHNCVAITYTEIPPYYRCFLFSQSADYTIGKEEGWASVLRTRRLWQKREETRLFRHYTQFHTPDHVTCFMHCLKEEDECAAITYVNPSPWSFNCLPMRPTYLNSSEQGWTSFT